MEKFLVQAVACSKLAITDYTRQTTKSIAEQVDNVFRRAQLLWLGYRLPVGCDVPHHYHDVPWKVNFRRFHHTQLSLRSWAPEMLLQRRIWQKHRTKKSIKIYGGDDVNQDDILIPIKLLPSRRDVLKAVSTICRNTDDLVNNPIAHKLALLGSFNMQLHLEETRSSMNWTDSFQRL